MPETHDASFNPDHPGFNHGPDLGTGSTSSQQILPGSPPGTLPPARSKRSRNPDPVRPGTPADFRYLVTQDPEKNRYTRGMLTGRSLFRIR
jgi:hypothetical protein